MRVGDEASAMARAMAASERGSAGPPVGDVGAARSHARMLRLQVMRALRAVTAAHATLAETVRAVVEDGTDLVLEDSPYPDDAQAYDLVQGPAVAYEQLAGWVASLEGRAPLAELLLQEESADQPYGEDVMPCGVDAPASAQPVHAVIGQGVMLFGRAAELLPLSPLEGRHGPLFEVELFELEPGGMVEVRLADGSMSLRVSPQDAEDPRLLHARLVEASTSLRQGAELGESMVARSRKASL
jgi:hypothetical protein